MSKSTVRYISFPLTEPPPPFAEQLVDVFRKHEGQISTESLGKGLTSDKVLTVLGPDLLALGFQIELGKLTQQKIDRPVFFGEDGRPIVRYQIDVYNPNWKCGLEIEAGRAWMGNAVYKDLMQATVMVEVDFLCLAVPNAFKYLSKKTKPVISRDFSNTKDLAAGLFSHTRLSLPYRLLVVGY